MINSIFVSNVAATVTAETLTDFFSFCGEVLAVDLHSAEDGTQNADVVFAIAEAKDTALLLSGSFLVDRAILVTLANDKADTGDGAKEPIEAEATEPESLTAGNAAAARSRAAIVELIAAGYSLGSRAIQYVQELDEQRNGGAGARAFESGVGFVRAKLDKGQQLAKPLATATLAKGQHYAERALENPQVAATLAKGQHYAERALNNPQVAATLAKGQQCAERALNNPKVAAGLHWATVTLAEARGRIEQEQHRQRSKRAEAARQQEAVKFCIEESDELEPTPPPVVATRSEQGAAINPVVAAAA